MRIPIQPVGKSSDPRMAGSSSQMISGDLFRIPRIKPVLAALAVVAFVQTLLVIGQALSLSAAITKVWEGQRVGDQLGWVALFFVLFVARQFVRYLRDRQLAHYAHAQAVGLRKQLLQKVFELGPTFVQKEGSAGMVAMNIEGVSQVENYITLMLPKLVNLPITPVMIAIALFCLDVRSGLVVVIVLPVIGCFMVLLGKAARAKASKQYKGFQRMGNHFLDVLQGLDTLKLLGLGKQYEKNVYEVSEDYRKATMSTLRVAILSTFALDFFTTLSVAMIALFLGIQLMEGTLLLFPALAVLILAPEFFLPLREFAGDYHATLAGGNTLKDMVRIVDMPSPAEVEDFHLAEWTEKDVLRFQEVSFRYSAESEGQVLEGLDFEWRGYGKIGIVGLSGSGKSTLIKVLGGFLLPQDSAGIWVDDQNVQHLHQRDWQNQLLHLPQDPYLFADTVRNNISFYLPDASDAEVVRAVTAAGLEQVIAELPEGLDTLIGEGGQTLSGGQAQRVALARAFLDQGRKVLLFDEPTAHLDIETEDELRQTMLPLFEDHLVFFATHRLHWMREMDHILVMEGGRIVEQGSYEALRGRKESVYNRLASEIGGRLS